MSAVASFYLLNISQLDELNKNATIIVKKSLFSKKVTDNYPDYLANNAKRLKDFDGNGYIYANLIVFLQEERDMDLSMNEYESFLDDLSEKRSSSHFLITHKQKETFLPQLDPGKYSLSELQKFNKDFSEEGDQETAKLTLDAIRLLHTNLSEVQNDEQVLLLIVG